MTNHWVDIKNADVVLIMGGNAAEAHPCGFKWVTEAKAHNKAKLIVVDPRFTRTASVADYYAPIRPGTDIVFLGGRDQLPAHERQDPARVRQQLHRFHLHRTRRLRASTEGFIPAITPTSTGYDRSSWDYEIGADGFVKTDPTLAHPRCVYNLMKQHYARYTPEMVERVCGTPQAPSSCSLGADRLDLHTDARHDDHVRARMDPAFGWLADDPYGAMVQLLLGNIGVVGGGMNALRGHSNIQGLTDLGLLSTSCPAI